MNFEKNELTSMTLYLNFSLFFLKKETKAKHSFMHNALKEVLDEEMGLEEDS